MTERDLPPPGARDATSGTRVKRILSLQRGRGVALFIVGLVLVLLAILALTALL